MQLKQALEGGVRRLEENDVGSPRMNAEVLLIFTLGCDRAYLYAHPERELTDEELERYDEALAERARGVPSQYITGHQEFWGLDLLVGPAVLIPRPETEHVVETVLELVRPTADSRGSAQIAEKKLASARIDPRQFAVGRSGAERRAGGSRHAPKIVDVGTGSGAIALALAHELPQADIWATDVSAAALEIAQANAARLQLAERVRFVESDLMEQVADADFDVIASNPPYVGEGEADKVQREVKKFEPRIAVFAGAEGLDVIARLIPQARERLKPGGWLVMEIGYTQEQAVRALLSSWAEVRSVPDLQGIQRVVAARKS